MSRDALKIVTIGGGSSYTPELIEGYFVLDYLRLVLKMSEFLYLMAC